MGQDGEEFEEVALKGTALFERDRWVAELDVRETQTLAVLVGEAKQEMSTMPNPVNEEGKIAPQYERLRASYTIEETPDGRLQVITKLKIDIRLVEIHGGYDPQASETSPIKTAVEEDVHARVAALIAKLQEYGLDSLDIGRRIKQQKPKLWKTLEGDWQQIYPTVEFLVEPQATVRTVGLIKTYLKLGE